MVTGGKRLSNSKLIKNFLRSAISQDHLNELAEISLEMRFVTGLLKLIIDDFDTAKCSKIRLQGGNTIIVYYVNQIAVDI